jgi:hypothetical protein
MFQSRAFGSAEQQSAHYQEQTKRWDSLHRNGHMVDGEHPHRSGSHKICFAALDRVVKVQTCKTTSMERKTLMVGAGRIPFTGVDLKITGEFKRAETWSNPPAPSCSRNEALRSPCIADTLPRC